MGIRIKTDNIEEKVLTYLKDKYDEEFTIEDTMFKFEPGKRSYELLTCEDSKYGEKFFVYYYNDSQDIEIESENEEEKENLTKMLREEELESSICDDYGKNILGHKYESIINSKLKETDLVICQMTMYDYYPSKEDVELPFDESEKKWRDKAYPNIYIFSNSNEEAESIMKRIEETLDQHHLYSQNVFVCKLDKVVKDELKASYREQFENYEDYISESNQINKITYFSVVDGEVKSKTVTKE